MSKVAIEFSDVHKYYGSLHVLRGINLKINQGEKVILMGHSGCGKSSLLRCVNALEGIDQGEILVNNTRLTARGSYREKTAGGAKLDLNAFRANIGMVFQQYNLFPHLTVLENIILGPIKVKGFNKSEAIETAQDLLKRVGIPEKVNAYPEQLSGGQKQRVAIARCLAMKPEMILLDEPTSALDPPMTREVLGVIQDVVEQGMTMVMVTHEYKFARSIADRIVFIDQGCVLETGPPNQLFDSPGHVVTKEYFETLH